MLDTAYQLLFAQLEDAMLEQRFCGSTQQSEGNHERVAVFFPDDVAFIGYGPCADCMREHERASSVRLCFAAIKLL